MLLSEAIRRGILSDEEILCPHDSCNWRHPFLPMIWHLRNQGWTHDHIADWVAEQERKLGITEPTGTKAGDRK